MNYMENKLTIAQAKKYTGYSRPTWLKWLNSGTVKGEKGAGEKDTWFVDASEVERIRLEKLAALQATIDFYSTPVPEEYL